MALTNDMTYLCSAGETFDSIALGVYGAEKYACHLMNANPGLCGCLVFAGGEQLTVPVITIAESDSGGAHAPSAAPWKE